MVDEEFEAFVRERGDDLVPVAYLLCRDRGRSEDLTQVANVVADGNAYVVDRNAAIARALR